VILSLFQPQLDYVNIHRLALAYNHQPLSQLLTYPFSSLVIVPDKIQASHWVQWRRRRPMTIGFLASSIHLLCCVNMPGRVPLPARLPGPS